jgi:hypothetical protein
MRKSAALLLALVFLTASCLTMAKPVSAASPNSWTSKAPMHQARSMLGVAAVNGKIYAIGGSIASGFSPSIPASAAYGDIDLGGFVGTNEEYDPTTDKWTYKVPMPTPRMALATAVYQNKVYCIGGRSVSGDRNGGFTAVNEVYDPATDTWETKAPMPSAAGWLVANVVYGKIYVLDYSGANYVYDPATDSWTTKAPVPASAFDGYASAVLDGKIYVIGGLSAGSDSNLNFIYNIETDKWSAGAPPPSSHGGGAAGATTGAMAPKRVYVFGEVANIRQGENPDFVRVYNPKIDDWTYGADNPSVNRYNFGVAVVNETFYVVGGHTYNFTGNFVPSSANEQYTPIDYGAPDPSYVPPDSTMPEISVTSPENETCYTTNVPLSFTVNKPDTWMRYKLDGKTVVEVEGNSTLAGLSAGLHNITIFVTDAAGNTAASETIYFTVDDTAPVVSVTAPENKIYYTIDIALNFTVNEPVSSMRYELDGETFEISGNTTIAGLSYGAHNLTVYAVDVAGNTGASEIISFIIEAPFPVVPVAAASVGSVIVVGVGLLVYFKKRRH